MHKRTLAATIGLAGLMALATFPSQAAASSTATDTLALTAGSLSISGLSNPTISAAASAGTTSTPLNSGTWTDATGLGLGWNGTLALESFVFQGAWTWSSGTTALTVTTSGAYTGTASQASIALTVTGTPTNSTTPFSYTDTENSTVTTGSGTASNGSAATIANGMTITFNNATTYTAGAVYDVEMGALPTTAVVLHTASGSVAAQTGTLGGTNLPLLVNNGSAVTSASATS